MIDEKIKNAYAKLAPSEECYQRIIEKAQSEDRTREFRRRVTLLKRVGYAVAAFALVFATAFIAASGIFSSDKFGVYYNGEAISQEYVLAKAESVDYVVNGVMLARHTVVEETSTLKAHTSISLELYGKSATVTVTDGMILSYDTESKGYVEGGNTLPFSGKTKIAWALPEAKSGTYELTVKSEDGLYKLVATYDAKSNTISLKTK